MVQSLSAAGLWRTRSCLRAWMRRSGRQSSLLWVRSSWWSACGASTLRVWSTTTRWKSAATATRGKHQQTITAIGRSSVGKKARFLTGFAACLAADRKSVENRGFGVAVRKVRCHRGEDGTVRVSSVETMHERRYTVDDWRYDTADCEQTENGQKS